MPVKFLNTRVIEESLQHCRHRRPVSPLVISRQGVKNLVNIKTWQNDHSRPGKSSIANTAYFAIYMRKGKDTEHPLYLRGFILHHLYTPVNHLHRRSGDNVLCQNRALGRTRGSTGILDNRRIIILDVDSGRCPASVSFQYLRKMQPPVRGSYLFRSAYCGIGHEV